MNTWGPYDDTIADFRESCKRNYVLYVYTGHQL